MKSAKETASVRTSAAIQADIEANEREFAQHKVRAGELQDQSYALLSDRSAWASNQGLLAEVEDGLRYGEGRRKMLAKEHKAALDREAEEAQWTALRAASAASEKFLAQASIRHAAVTAQVSGFFADWVETERLIFLANADLPEGAAPLPSIEATLRVPVGKPEKVLQDDEVELWSVVGSHYPIADELQSKVVKDTYTTSMNYFFDALGRRQNVVKKRFRRLRYKPAVAAWPAPNPFLVSVQWPGLGAYDRAAIEPWILPQAAAEFESLLDYLRALPERQGLPEPSRGPREAVTEYTLIVAEPADGTRRLSV